MPGDVLLQFGEEYETLRGRFSLSPIILYSVVCKVDIAPGGTAVPDDCLHDVGGGKT